MYQLKKGVYNTHNTCTGALATLALLMAEAGSISVQPAF